MRAEYRHEELGKGVRGKHFALFKNGRNLMLLAAGLSKVFPINEAVNTALSSLVSVARSVTDANRRLTPARAIEPPAPVK